MSCLPCLGGCPARAPWLVLVGWRNVILTYLHAWNVLNSHPTTNQIYFQNSAVVATEFAYGLRHHPPPTSHYVFGIDDSIRGPAFPFGSESDYIVPFTVEYRT